MALASSSSSLSGWWSVGWEVCRLGGLQVGGLWAGASGDRRFMYICVARTIFRHQLLARNATMGVYDVRVTHAEPNMKGARKMYRTPPWKKKHPAWKYDEEAFNPQLNENMADDPYGTAMYVIGQALAAAMDDEIGEHMNEAETVNLRTIARAYIGADRFVACPVCGAFSNRYHSNDCAREDGLPCSCGLTDSRPGGYIDFDPGDPETGPMPNVVPCYLCNLQEALAEGWEE